MSGKYLKPGRHERRGRHEAPPPFTARQYLVAVTSMWLDFKMLTLEEDPR